MNRKLISWGFVFLCACHTFGRNSNRHSVTSNRTDSPTSQSEITANKRWTFAPLPTISYSSDLGLQLGALCDIYHFTKDAQTPDYKDKIYIDFGLATKGSGYIHSYYDSPHITDNLRLTASVTYKISSLYPFYGFNGLASPFIADKNLNKNSRTAFYNTGLNMLRLMATLQGKIYGHLKWMVGTNFWSFKVKDIPSKYYNPDNTLLKEYLKSGIINDDEANGGNHFELRCGLTYDSRDNDAAPQAGIWAEAYLYGSKDFSGRGYDYLKSSIHFRHYFPIWQKHITGAYHLAYQGVIAGEPPFYMQQEISAILLKQPETDGLGGRNTVRGLLLARLLGNGYIWGNFEVRCLLYSFDLFRHHWNIGTNPFFDFGMIVQPYRLDRMRFSGNPSIYSGMKEKPHFSYGAGIKLSMDYNFILSAELARPFSRKDGQYGLNIGVNYIF